MVDKNEQNTYNVYCAHGGVWLSLVEHLVWDQGVAGSNPVTPTSNYIYAGVVQW